MKTNIFSHLMTVYILLHLIPIEPLANKIIGNFDALGTTFMVDDVRTQTSRNLPSENLN